MTNHSREEPRTAPQSDHWYDLTLGPTFKKESSNKFCTLRYEFKPASIDKAKPGSLKKTKENRVTVEFQNNQLGKPNVTFVGSIEDYKENDAVLFFDGHTFRLERLHRAMKQLRHNRQPGESAAAAATSPAPPVVSSTQSGPTAEARLSPAGKAAKLVRMVRSPFPAMPVEVERIDIGEPENPGLKYMGREGPTNYSSDLQNIHASSPGLRNDDADKHQDIDIDEIFGTGTSDDEEIAVEGQKVNNPGLDINVPNQNDTDDDEIADVDDDSGDEAERGPNAAEALRAQVNAEGRDKKQSTSSSSSGSGSSASGSSSSGSDSEASDEDSVNSV